MTRTAQNDTVNFHTLPNTDTDSGPSPHSSSRHDHVEKERLNASPIDGQHAETQVTLSVNHGANAPMRKSKTEKKAPAHVDVPALTTLMNREGKRKDKPCSVQPTVHAMANVKEKDQEKKSLRVAH